MPENNRASSLTVPKRMFINETKVKIYGKDGKYFDNLIFGDEIGVTDAIDNEFSAITYKKDGTLMNGFISKETSLTQNRTLELYFIDVGQGDSVLMHTPLNERILIDGGPDNTMHKFLQSKYKSEPEVFFKAIIMTHADKDHSAGLISILNDKKFKINTFLHNGIPKFENRPGSRIGKVNGKGEDQRLFGMFDHVDQLKTQEMEKVFGELIETLKNKSGNAKESISIKRIDHTFDLAEYIKNSSIDSHSIFRTRVLWPINCCTC